MLSNKDCTYCESCEDTLYNLNNKIISIVDADLYNVRFELNRYVDRRLFVLLKFYREVLQNICNDTDCDCYGDEDNRKLIIERIKILSA